MKIMNKEEIRDSILGGLIFFSLMLMLFGLFVFCKMTEEKECISQGNIYINGTCFPKQLRGEDNETTD